MDIEQLATSAIINRISKTHRLKAFINSGDKEPSFDGHIYIYDNDKLKKTNIRKVSVQVKGYGVKRKRENKIKYSISRVDLNNYLNDGGVIFFVVDIDEKNGNILGVYYVPLLPLKIKDILENSKNKNRKMIPVIFGLFPHKEKDIMELFLNFYSKSKKQISFVQENLPSFEDLKSLIDKGEIESFSFGYNFYKLEESSRIGFPISLIGKEISLSIKMKNFPVPIPIKKADFIVEKETVTLNPFVVEINGKIYYEKVERISTVESDFIKIGNCVEFEIPINNDGDASARGRVHTEIKGNLHERIRDIEFIIAMLKSKSLKVGDMDISISFSDDELERMQFKSYPEYLVYYKSILNVLEKLRVKKTLNFDNLSDEDYVKIDILIKSIEKKELIKKPELNNGVYYFEFGEVKLLLISKKQESGGYYLFDYFDKKTEVFIKDKNDKKVIISQYVFMRADDFNTVDNISLQRIVEDFKQIEVTEPLVELGNNILLEMIKAYDLSLNKELFYAIIEMIEWLNSCKDFISEEIILLNTLQVSKRERNLDFNERKQLHRLIEKTEDVIIKIGALILLDEFKEVDVLLKVVSEKDKELVMSYPISHFYKQYLKEAEKIKN